MFIIIVFIASFQTLFCVREHLLTKRTLPVATLLFSFAFLFVFRLYLARWRAFAGPGLTEKTYLEARVCHLLLQTECSFIPLQ